MATRSSRRVGRPRALTTDTVADAVLAVGFIDLKVSDVAAHLDVNPATVYRFAGGIDRLIGLAISRLVQTIPWPEPDGNWRAYLEATTWTVWTTMSDHPGLASATGMLSMTNPDLLSRFDQIITALMNDGFSATDAVIAVDLVLDLAFDSVKLREARTGAPTNEVPAARDNEWTERFSPAIRAIMADALVGDPRAWFARKLAVALDGLACLPSAPSST